MPGYLIKAANFVAEIDNDEELVHLAQVDTVKKETKICVLPGKTWIEAKKLPILRKVWGLDNDGAVPAPIEMTIKPPQVPIKTKLPPRVSTVIDSRENIMAMAEMQKKAMQDAPRPALEPENIERDTDVQSIIPILNHGDHDPSGAFHAISPDVVQDVPGQDEDDSEILDMQAISQAAGSSMVFEISDLEASGDETRVRSTDMAVIPMYLGASAGAEHSEHDSVQDLADAHDLVCLPEDEHEPNENPQEIIPQEIIPIEEPESSSPPQPPVIQPPAPIFTIKGIGGIGAAPKNSIKPAPSSFKSSASTQMPAANEISDENKDLKLDSSESSVDAEDTVHHGPQGENWKSDEAGKTTKELDMPVAMDDLESRTESLMLRMRSMADDEHIEVAPDEVTYVMESNMVEEMRCASTSSEECEDEDKTRVGYSDISKPVTVESSDECILDSGFSSIEISLDWDGQNKPAEHSDCEIRMLEMVQKISEEHALETDLDTSATQPMVQPRIEDIQDAIHQSSLAHHAMLDHCAESAESESRPQDSAVDEQARTRARIRIRRPGRRGRERFNSGDINNSILESGVEPIVDELTARPQDGIREEKSDLPLAEIPGSSAGNGTLEHDEDRTQDWGKGKYRMVRCAKENDPPSGTAEDSTSEFSDIQAQEIRAARAAVDAARQFAKQQGDHLDQSILIRAASLVDALEEAQSRTFERVSRTETNSEKEANGSEFLDESPSEAFIIRNRSELRLAAAQAQAESDLGLSHRDAMTLKAEETITKKRPIKTQWKQDNDAFFEEHSDVLKIRNSSELRHMIEAEAKAAATSNHLSRGPEDGLSSNDGVRSLFEKENELHIYLAQEIRDKEAKNEEMPKDAKDVSHPQKQNASESKNSPNTLQLLTNERPVQNERAIVKVSPQAGETTSVIEQPKFLSSKKKEISLSFKDDFFKDKFIDGEEPIAQFSTLYLTTHRIWKIIGSHDHIENYEVFDIENVQGIALRDEKNWSPILINLLFIALVSGYYLLLNQAFWVIFIIIYGVFMLPLCYWISFRTTLQVSVGNTTIKSQSPITKANRTQAMMFLNRIEAARTERRRHLGLH